MEEKEEVNQVMVRSFEVGLPSTSTSPSLVGDRRPIGACLQHRQNRPTPPKITTTLGTDTNADQCGWVLTPMYDVDHHLVEPTPLI